MNVILFNNIYIYIISGMSSFPLTKSIIFQDGEIAPPTRIYIYIDYINHILTININHELVTLSPNYKDPVWVLPWKAPAFSLTKRANGRWQLLTGFIKVEIWRKSPLVQPGKGGFFGKTIVVLLSHRCGFMMGISWDILLDMDLSSYGYLVVLPT